MHRQRKRFRPFLEHLEHRDNPSNLSVTLAGHTLIIAGDTSDDLTIQGVTGDATKFTLSSGSDTFNGQASPFTTPTGVHNMTFTLQGNNDGVTFGNAVRPILLEGNLTINGGDGANTVTTTDLTVQKNVSITNGNGTGTDGTYLTNLTVGGSLTIKNGNSETETEITRNVAGISTIGGNLSITNGAGYDFNELLDTNVGGSVTIANGHGNGSGLAGYTYIYAYYNSVRSVIGGNLTISYLDGNGDGYDGIWDTEVLGNITINHGTGAFTTYFDGYHTSLPDVVLGSVTMTGSGANTVAVGTQYSETGLIVGKNLTITGSASDTLTFYRLEVGGATKLTLGNAGNTVNIDGSELAGTFTLTTGSGNDTFNLEMSTTVSYYVPTEFGRSVVISLGTGSNTGNVAFNHTSSNQAVVVLGTFVVTGSPTWNQDQSQEFFPFGGQIHVT
jgi:hypothetical protein